jgi:hypothetical protein
MNFNALSSYSQIENIHSDSSIFFSVYYLDPIISVVPTDRKSFYNNNDNNSILHVLITTCIYSETNF